jgi:hypothetical protein
VKRKTFRWIGPVAFAAAIALPNAAATAQTNGGMQSSQSVTSSDIQQLQDAVYDAGGDIARLRSRDASLAGELQTKLDDLRDDVTYLKVKLRREGSVSRSDFDDVRSQIADVRSQARGTRQEQSAPADNPAWTTNSGAATGQASGGYSGGTQESAHPARQTRPGEVPSGQQLDVRLEQELSSGTAQVEDRFSATTVVDLYQDDKVLIPAGSTLRGVVSSVNKATRTDRKGSMTLAFDQITVRGRSYQMRGTVEQAIESEGVKGEATKIGAGAGVGAVLGGILGGAKGALLGILIGGGGTIAATPGKDVTLPAGTVLRVRLDTPIQIR